MCQYDERRYTHRESKINFFILILPLKTDHYINDWYYKIIILSLLLSFLLSIEIPIFIFITNYSSVYFPIYLGNFMKCSSKRQCGRIQYSNSILLHQISFFRKELVRDIAVSTYTTDSVEATMTALVTPKLLARPKDELINSRDKNIKWIILLLIHLYGHSTTPNCINNNKIKNQNKNP